MSGGIKSVKVVLRNPLDKKDQLDYTIELNDVPLAQDWATALSNELRAGRLIEKNFCFMGFPHTPRNLNLSTFYVYQNSTSLTLTHPASKSKSNLIKVEVF